MSYQVCGVGRERTYSVQYEVAGAHLLLITDVGRQAAQSGVAADPCILDLATAVLAWTHHPWPCNMYSCTVPSTKDCNEYQTPT